MIGARKLLANRANTRRSTKLCPHGRTGREHDRPGRSRQNAFLRAKMPKMPNNKNPMPLGGLAGGFLAVTKCQKCQKSEMAIETTPRVHDQYPPVRLPEAAAKTIFNYPSI